MTLKVYHCNGEGLPDYPEHVEMSDVEIYWHDSLMFCQHNTPCAICHVKPAVLNANAGNFMPCWDCQKEGHKLIKVTDTWLDKILENSGLLRL